MDSEYTDLVLHPHVHHPDVIASASYYAITMFIRPIWTLTTFYREKRARKEIRRNHQ